MAESVDALVSNTSGAIRAGSIPAPGTTKCKCLIFKRLHFSFSFLHHACTTEWAVLGQNRYFSKNFSVGPLSFVRSVAKLVKVGVNGKKEASQKLFEQNKDEYNSSHQGLQNNL